MSNHTAPHADLGFLRENTLGIFYRFRTPFGCRYMSYADYTASGRNLKFIEDYLLRIERSYANTHTEDDITGKSTTELLHEAERIIKRCCGGNESTRVIATGTGATGAIQRFQEIVGVHLPPVTKNRIHQQCEMRLEDLPDNPVVFIGPYEHHSNEVTWRESLAEVVKIGLTKEGLFDLEDLEARVSDPRYAGRYKIGSFSAASNVTGLLTPLYDVAAIMHKYNGIVCFDFAACAPYIEIDMNRDDKSYFDAIYFSPHKFLGGPGSSGILLINEKIYRRDLPPTCGGGGTVAYVNPEEHDYLDSIEEREKPGTPGVLQIMKAALALELKEKVSVETIERIEHDYTSRAMACFNDDPNIEVLGNPEPDNRVAIVSFNIRHGERYLHPKFVTTLLNDLFGIQTRAGCSCAGPYGHLLLHIGMALSGQYRTLITKRQLHGIKPGWVRVGFHFTMSERDFNFICEAIRFVSRYGHLFLGYYTFDINSGTWTCTAPFEADHFDFGIDHAIELKDSPLYQTRDTEERYKEYDEYLSEAKNLAEKLQAKPQEYITLEPELEKLCFFRIVHLTE